MSPSVAAIIEELKAAFPSVRAQRFLQIVNSNQGDEPLRIEADFADKPDWTELTPEWLDEVPDGLGTALSFLSDEAIRFYIPAFMAADLLGRLERVDPTFVLVHGLTEASRGLRIWPRKEKTWTDHARAKWDSLTQAQVAAIIRYLQWCVERDGPVVGYTIVEALAEYWHPYAQAGASPRPPEK